MVLLESAPQLAIQATAVFAVFPTFAVKDCC
jgi:hypothetical protein